MKTMAKKKNWLGMLVIALVFGMTVVGCGGSRLNGTWVGADGRLFKFNNGSFEVSFGPKTMKGTYTTSGNSLTLLDDGGDEIETATYSVRGNTLTVDGATLTKKRE